MNEPILIIDGPNFEEIQLGIKKHEFRSLSDFYGRLFCVREKGEYVGFKPINAVWFALGYRSDRKMLKVEVKEINIDTFVDIIPEGFKKGDQTFTLDLGVILDSVNV